MGCWHQTLSFVLHGRWGYVLAEGLPGRGRGSRAALAELRGGALLHDASYWRPVQLAGALPALRTALEMLWFVLVLGRLAGLALRPGVKQK